VARHSELANHKHVERRAKCAGDFIRNRHAATRQSQQEHVRPIGITGQLASEQPARFAAITESFWNHLSFAPSGGGRGRVPSRTRAVADACHRVSEPTGQRATANIGVKALRGIDHTFHAAVHHCVHSEVALQIPAGGPRLVYDEVIVQADRKLFKMCVTRTDQNE
jgi:hypothetical protein